MPFKKDVKKARAAVLPEKTLSFLRDYINTPSPTGHESEGQKLWLNYIRPFVDDYLVDNYGTVAGIINPGAKYKVAIEAHADEISWYVNYIAEDGLIYVCRNGGSDHQIAPSKRVNIHTKGGVVKAVFGWPAIHMRKEDKDEQPPTLKNIFLDCGCTSRKEVEKLGVHVGCVITYEDAFMVLNNRYYVGRALDNRIGGFVIAETARRLREQKFKLSYSLYLVNSVQEEVGMHGATMIARSVKPDLALVTDVTHDSTTPMISKKIQGECRCGLGPVLSYAPAVHNRLLDLLVNVAGKKKIPFQRAAASNGTGTDTEAFAYANGGIVSALVSIPLRYMHTTVEMVRKEDVENAIRLLCETLKQIKPGQDFRYLK